MVIVWECVCVPLSAGNFDALHRLQDDDIVHTYRLACLDRDIVRTVDLAADCTYVLIAVRRATVAVAGAAPCDDDACLRFLLNRCNIYWEAAICINGISINITGIVLSTN